MIGYYTLASGSVSRDDVPPRGAKGLGRYPAPNALLRALQASELVGSRPVVVHAKDQSAAEFYRRYQFDPSPLDEFHLYLLMKEIRSAVGE